MTNDQPLLPRETTALIDAELRPGERIVWVGRPIPARFARGSGLTLLFGIPWVGMAIVWIVFAGLEFFGQSSGDQSAGDQVFKLLWFLGGLPFGLIGFGILYYPLWKRRQARKTAYVITDRRAILFENRWGDMAVRSFEAGQLGELRRVQNPDGSGDLIFSRDWRTDSDGEQQSTDIGFLAIAEVKSVEDMIRALTARTTG